MIHRAYLCRFARPAGAALARNRVLQRSQRMRAAAAGFAYPDCAQDIADKATNSYTKEFLYKKSNDDRFILRLVQEALKRLEGGGYGTCVACGGEMQQKRLDAVPWARHCIECQEKQEMGLLES